MIPKGTFALPTIQYDFRKGGQNQDSAPDRLAKYVNVWDRPFLQRPLPLVGNRFRLVVEFVRQLNLRFDHDDILPSVEKLSRFTHLGVLPEN
jgi:hypothetical protein